MGAFAAVLAFALWKHEPWRDELQAWMIVRASRTPIAVLDNLRHEGHPPLWYLLLWPVRQISGAIAALQVVEWVIAVATVALLAWRAPFSRLVVAGLAFGYFGLFEYGVLARSYALGTLLLVAALVAARPSSPRRPRPALATVALALLALTSAFGAIVAVTITIALLAEILTDRRTERDTDGSRRRAALRSEVLQAGVVFGAAVLAYSQAAPVDDAGAFSSWNTHFDAHLLSTTVASIFRALAPIPHLQHSWWNSSVLDGHTGVAAIIAVALFAVITWSLRRSIAAVATWMIGTTAIVVFLYLKIGQADAARYYGHIFSLFVAAVWLHTTRPRPEHLHVVDDHGPAWMRPRTLLVGVLVVQVVVGIGAVVSDALRPFTDAPATAEWLIVRGERRVALVGCHDFAASSVAAVLDRTVQYQEGDRAGTFVTWDKRRTRVVATLAEARERALDRRPGRIYYVVNREVPTLSDRLVFQRGDGIVADEHFWVYDLTAPTPPALRDPCRTR